MGRYELIQEIGKGGMSIVYRAIDSATQSEVVLKLLRKELQKTPSLVCLFEESGRVQQLLRHPNIAPVIEIGQDKGISFIVQPYYAKGALDRWFRQIDLDLLAQVFIRVCAAVQFAHENGEIHGDIKSANVLIGPDGQILLTDFISVQALSQVMQSSGLRWGTPAYIAPEVLILNKMPDVKADIYALGILLFEAVRGYLPRQLDEREILANRIQAELPLLLDIQYNWINDILLQTVQPDPDRRFNSVQEIITMVRVPAREYDWPAYPFSPRLAWLEFEDGRPNKELKVGTCSIGSDRHCDILVQNQGIFGQYAEIDYRDGVFLIRRTNEDVELFLNGERVRFARVLYRGDQIRLQNIKMKFAFFEQRNTQQLSAVQVLPVGWIKMSNRDGWEGIPISENPIRIIEQSLAYVEIQPVAGKLRLVTSMPADSLLVNGELTDGLELSEGDSIEWRGKHWMVHYAHDAWMKVIDDYLLLHGEVSEHNLFEIPSNCRLIAMRQYTSARPYLDISFSADGRLKCNDVERLRLLRQLWMDSNDTFDKRIGIEIIGELVELIREKLFVSKTKRTGEGFGTRYGNFMVFALEISSVIRGLNLSPSIPLIFAKSESYTPNALSNLLEAVRSHPQMPHLAIIVFLDEKTKQFTFDAVEQLQHVYKINVLALEREDIQRILFSRDPQRSLKAGLLSRADLSAISPFVINGPAKSQVFFGREREMREICTKVNQVSFALIGGRRVGKTSLLLRLYKERLPVMNFRTLYFDCATASTYEDFLNAPPKEWQPEPPPNMPNSMALLLQSPPTDKPFVLILDEADKLVPFDRASGWPLFSVLRALVNTHRAQIILSGERALRSALRDPTSPLFNSPNEILLGPLEYQSVEELVTRPMRQLEIDLVDEKRLVDYIWEFTSGHPNVVQRLCYRLIQLLNESGSRHISLDDARAITENPVFQRDDFLGTYWEAATPLEKIISLLMADDRKITTLSAVQSAIVNQCGLKPKIREIDDAMQRLVDLRSILNRLPTGYDFAVTAFPRVVAGTMTMNDMLARCIEEYQEVQSESLTV
ncbi:MAG TPA: protein kinase [Anaerolineae bacterium]|nr:protein kinase [Anaerolineae bacterium]